MKTKILSFDLRVGGGYDMSLYYPPDSKDFKGEQKAKDRGDYKFRYD